MIQIERESFTKLIKKINKTRKALLIGSGGVGKTSLLNALEKHYYVNQNSTYASTPFINFGTIAVVDNKGEKIRIQFQDLAGQIDLPIHALKDFSRQTLGATDMVLLVFANNNLQSFIELKEWLELINEGITALNILPKFVLVQNKCDLETMIEQDFITAFLKANPEIKSYFKVNCFNGKGLDELTTFFSKEIA